MKLITVQNKKVIDILTKEGIYYADYNKISFKEYIPQYKELAKYCGFSHCPIFCSPKNDITSIESSNMYDREEDLVELYLDVPNNKCVKIDYYDWSDYIYYSAGYEYDDYFKFDAEQALHNIDKYLSGISKGRELQVCIEEILEEYVISYEYI